MCLRRQMRISTRTVYCVNVVDGGGAAVVLGDGTTTCCRSVQSQSHLWFSESDAGDMATALTWKLLDRFPLPSPRQPAPPFHLTPALRRYESHSNYQFTSSSSSICRYLATNRLCWAPLLSQSCLPSMHVLFFLSRSPAFLFILLRPPVCCCWRFSTTCPCLLLTKLLILV